MKGRGTGRLPEAPGRAALPRRGAEEAAAPRPEPAGTRAASPGGTVAWRANGSQAIHRRRPFVD